MPGYGLDEATADFVLCVVVGANLYMGWRYGLVRRAIAFAAVFGAAAAGYYVGDPLASVLGGGDLMSNAWAFVGVFAVTVVMIEILAALYGDLFRRMVTIVFDRVTGVAAGLVVGVLEVGVLFLVAQAVAEAPPTASGASAATRTTAAVAVDNGILTQFVVKLEPGIQNLLSPAMPTPLENRLDQDTAS